LPWRHTRDPYAIWVSEIMLQQTRVETVVPYYQRFMVRFPDMHALARAPLEEVLQMWSGLGYYRRARALSLAASEVVERYGGELPSEAAPLRTLSGVGRYTAGAVASIAFGRREPLVDGNVIRVLSRVFALTGDMRASANKQRVWALAETLVPSAQPGRFNQALMELGATVCTPQSPACARCPLRRRCVAKKLERVAEFPELSGKKPPRPVAVVAAVVRHRASGRVLLGRRRPDGLFGGLWEPPMIEQADAELTDDAELRRALSRHGVSVRATLEPAGKVRHVLTHRRMDVAVLSAVAKTVWRLPKEPTAPYQQLAWRCSDQVALSTLARKLLAAAVALVLVLLSPRGSWAAQPGSDVEHAGATESAAEGAAEPEVAEDDEDASASEDELQLDEDDMKIFKNMSRERARYTRLLLTVGAGGGFRFNNPYRLRTQLGDDAESVSATSPYFDAGLGVAFGEPNAIQHGAMAHLSVALEGVAQQAINLSYLLAYRSDSPVLVYGRIGSTLLTVPDPNVGAELAAGLGVFFTGGVGLTAELIGNLFYGAGSYEAEFTVIPILSMQGGLIVDFEVLP